MTWDELKDLRWGGADPTPGIDFDGPTPTVESLKRIYMMALVDPYAVAERKAIQAVERMPSVLKPDPGGKADVFGSG